MHFPRPCTGVKALGATYSPADWRYWVRLCLLVWVEWLGMITYRHTVQQDGRWLWVMFTTIIVVKPVTVVSINIGLQRMLGTLCLRATVVSVGFQRMLGKIFPFDLSQKH
jgi:hypothetical protein